MPAVEAFSSLPILQIFVGGITLLISVWMMVQAQRDKKSIPDRPIPDGQQMMLEGLASLRELVHAIRGLTMVMTQIERNQIRVKDELNKETERLTDQTRLQTDRHGELLRISTEILKSLDGNAQSILREMKARGR